MTAEWQTIDSAPKDGTVLVLYARCKTAAASAVIIGWFNLADEEWIEICYSPNRPIGVVPSHWMPRPPFPA